MRVNDVFNPAAIYSMPAQKMSLGDSLRKARSDAGLTQEQLALQAQVSYRFVQEIEANRQQPTLPVLFKLCAAMGITPDALIMPVWAAWLGEQN